MIYVDTSVALAALLAEDRHPPAELWTLPLISSRLTEYELWVRLNARGSSTTHREAAGELLAHLAFVELIEPILQRARDAFPVPVRTLDALHLASIEFLREQGADIRLATYDRRQSECAEALGITLYGL